MIPIKKVEKIIERYNSLEKELSSGKFDSKLFAQKSKEYSDLKDIINPAKEYLNFEKNKKDLSNLIDDKTNDKEMILLAQKELETAEATKANHEKKLILTDDRRTTVSSMYVLCMLYVLLFLKS